MDEYHLLKVSVQSALVGLVPENLFAVTCGIQDHRIEIAAYFDGTVGDDECELVRSLAREVASDFPSDHKVQDYCYSLQQSKLRMLDFWAFLRASTQNRNLLKMRAG